MVRVTEGKNIGEGPSVEAFCHLQSIKGDEPTKSSEKELPEI